MNWSIFLGAALIVYAVFVLARHIRRSAQGDCGACPFSSGCDGHCGRK